MTTTSPSAQLGGSPGAHRADTPGAPREQSYSELLDALEREALLDLVHEMARPMEIRYLDFACGTGRVVGELEKIVGRSVAVDVDRSRLDAAASRLTRTELICADLTRTPALDGRWFDLITVFDFFEQVDDATRRDAIAALRIVLTPGGRMLVACRCRPVDLRGWLDRFAIGSRRGAPKAHTISDGELRKLAALAGLDVSKVRLCGFWPFLDARKPLRSVSRLARFERWAAGQSWLAAVASRRIYVLTRPIV